MPTVALQPKTYATEDISATSPVVRCYFPQDGLHYAAAVHEQRMVAVANGWPRPLSAQPMAKTIVLDCRPQLTGDSDPDAAIQAFKAIFDPAEGERTLVVTDGTTDWEMDCSVVRMAAQNNTGNHWLVTLQATFGLWRDTGDRADTTAISAVASSAVALTTLGNQKTPPQIEVTPTAVKGVGNDQRYALQVVIAWRAPGAGLNYPIAIQMDTATEVTATRMQADGDDLRVIVDNVEVQRDLGTMNAALTNIWFVADWAPARSATIKSAMTAGSPATGADWDLGALADTSSLPDEGVLLIGTEAIHYTSKDADGHTLETVTRGVRNTTAASHSIADVAYYVEHDVQVIYGHTAAAAPTIDSDRTPQFDRAVASSNNGQWTYNSGSGFATAAGRRPGEWVPELLDPVSNPLFIATRGKHTALITTAVPTAAGEFDSSGTVVGAATRLDAINDPVGTPDDDTTYQQFTTAGAGVRVSVLATVVVPAGTVFNVKVHARAKANGASCTGNIYVHFNGTGYAPGAAQAIPNGSYGAISGEWTGHPVTLVPWTPGDVATLEIGFAPVSMGAATELRLTQLYVSINGLQASDPATALGVYYHSSTPLPQQPNQDAWVLPTRLGLAAAASLVASVEASSIEAATQRFQIRNADGVLRPATFVSLAASGTATLTASPPGPVSEIAYTVTALGTDLGGIALTAAAVVFDSANAPSVVVGSRQEAYVHRWTLNQEDDDTAISLLFVGFLTKTLTIDCEDGAITYEDAGRTCMSALSLNTRRREWLLLEVGGNSLTWADAANGAGVLDLVLRWRDRRN